MEDTQNEEIETGKSPEEQALDNLKGHDVDITNADGEKMETEKKDAEDKQEKEEDKKAEDKDIEQEIKDQKQAEADVKADLQEKGVDFDALAKEYEDNGSLSEESLKSLEKAGYPKTVVHSFIRGMEATAEEYTNAVYKLAGGEENYKQMTQFVIGLGEQEVNAFNRAIENGDITQLGAMFEGYKSRMTAKYGTANRSVLGQGGSASTGGFTSKDAMIKAMSDPKYGNDPEYTNKVQRMTMQSNIIE